MVSFGGYGQKGRPLAAVAVHADSRGPDVGVEAVKQPRNGMQLRSDGQRNGHLKNKKIKINRTLLLLSWLPWQRRSRVTVKRQNPRAHIVFVRKTCLESNIQMQHTLVYGGSGALGSALVAHFRQQKWVRLCRKVIPYLPAQTVISVDMRANPEANANILLSAQDSMEQQEKRVRLLLLLLFIW